MKDQFIILIVDDSSSGRDNLEALLLPENYRLLFADSGPAALEKASEQTPDLILLDIMMPGMDGFETCRRLRSNPRIAEVPILLVTALDDQASRLQGIQSGADDFISKPYNRAELRARVRTILRLNRYRHLLEERARFDQLIQLSPDGIMIVNGHGQVSLANPAALTMLGLSGEVLPDDLYFMDVLDEKTQALFSFPLDDHFFQPGPALTQEVCFLREDGTSLPVDLRFGRLEWEGETQVQIIARDITERKKMEERLAMIAMYDPLTGLPNHHLLQDRLQQMVERARRYRTRVGIIHLDIYEFRVINNTLGRSIGDQALVEVTKRLKENIRGSDTLARVSADEFVLVLPDLDGPETLPLIVEKLQGVFHEPLRIMGHELFIKLISGGCMYPRDGDEPGVLLKNASTALTFAKADEKQTYRQFENSMNETALERLRLTNELRTAIDQDELVVHYQPQIDLDRMTVIGFEALVRWNHPKLGLLYPARFIHLAEESGLIHRLGKWLVKNVCAQVAVWQRSEMCPLMVSINISAVQFNQENFLEEMIEHVQNSGVDPTWLAIEVTESLFIHDMKSVSGDLEKLRALGIQVYLDDFGTEYSSLAYLRQLPVDVLKIDKTFINDLTQEKGTCIDPGALVNAIVTLGHSLNMRVLAEGIETETQLLRLKSLGCDEGQGFFMGRPMGVEQLSDWQKQWETRDVRLMVAELPAVF